jgi:hypothetical protein
MMTEITVNTVVISFPSSPKQFADKKSYDEESRSPFQLTNETETTLPHDIRHHEQLSRLYVI